MWCLRHAVYVCRESGVMFDLHFVKISTKLCNL